MDVLSWSQVRFDVYIRIVLRLNALFTIYILPENTGPHCNYKIIRGRRGRGWSPSRPPPAVVMPVKAFFYKFAFFIFFIMNIRYIVYKFPCVLFSGITWNFSKLMYILLKRLYFISFHYVIKDVRNIIVVSPLSRKNAVGTLEATVFREIRARFGTFPFQFVPKYLSWQAIKSVLFS